MALLNVLTAGEVLAVDQKYGDANYPVANWPAASFTGWTDQTGPFQLWQQEETGHIYATAPGDVATPLIHPVRISDTGRVYGFYALEGQCHVGYESQGICVPATMDTVFARFNAKPIELDDGTTVNVGFGTAIGDHTDAVDADTAVALQVDISAMICVLHARYYPGVGIYLAGQMLEDLDADFVERCRLGYPSGHWFQAKSEMELTLFHWVTKPGYAPTWFVEPGPFPEGEAPVSASITAGTDQNKGTVMAKRVLSPAGPHRRPGRGGVSASYLIEPAPEVKFVYGARLELADGGYGMYDGYIEGADGETLIIVRVETDGELPWDNRVAYPEDQVTDTGQVYVYDWDGDDDEVVAAAAPVRAACCTTCAKSGGTCSKKAADTVSGDVATQISDLETAVADLVARVEKLETAADDSTDSMDTGDPMDTVDASEQSRRPRFPAHTLDALAAAGATAE